MERTIQNRDEPFYKKLQKIDVLARKLDQVWLTIDMNHRSILPHLIRYALIFLAQPIMRVSANLPPFVQEQVKGIQGYP